MTRVEQLLSISSNSLAPSPLSSWNTLDHYPLGPELRRMLELKNGFYAFESALHVFPLTRDPAAGLNLEEWNSDSLWRSDYGDLTTGLLFFAEDVFQDQFCLSANGVLRFDAETGGSKPLAGSLEQWADGLLRDRNRETGWTFAHKWQLENGTLPHGKRLMPKTPFFLGGAYTLDNLWAGDAVEGIRFKADLAMQTRSVPDGAEVRLIIGKKPAN